MIDVPDIRQLLVAGPGPRVSLYQPTSRPFPESQQNPIRFRNLLKQAESSLRKAKEAASAAAVLEPLRALAADDTFWNHPTDGLAVFCAPDGFRVVRLQRPVPELVVVADSFHIKPMLRIVQSADRYQVLSVNRREIRMFEGNRDVLDAIDLGPEVPATITDALGEEPGKSQGLAFWHGAGSAGGAGSRGPRGEKMGGMGHGHSWARDGIEIDTERFFRAVDRAVLEHHSRPTGLPLILAALPEHHALFRSVSKNPQLVTTGIEMNPEALSIDELRQRAWAVMQPVYLGRLAGLIERFGAARAASLGDDRIEEVAKAAVAGRVDTLLVEAERHIPGRIDETTGAVSRREPPPPQLDDALDDLAELVLRMAGEVVIVPRERMPTGTGVAAIYRY